MEMAEVPEELEELEGGEELGEPVEVEEVEAMEMAEVPEELKELEEGEEIPEKEKVSAGKGKKEIIPVDSEDLNKNPEKYKNIAEDIISEDAIKNGCICCRKRIYTII